MLCDQFLDGGHAGETTIVIQNGEVTVNGEVDTRRGRKLYPQDNFCYQGQEVTVIGES